MVDKREYKQGVATLGFEGGPQVVFRLNPSDVAWNFEVNTNVAETVGGRVVQVLGANLSDMTIKGSFGEPRGKTHTTPKVLAENFLVKMKEMAEFQSKGSTRHGGMHRPAVFSFPTRGWKFRVYIKDLTDPDGGGSITHRTGKYAYDYVLTLFIDSDMSDTSKILGDSNGVLSNQKNAAISSYINRITDGIGWTFSEFNGRGSEILGQPSTAPDAERLNIPASGTGTTADGTTGSTDDTQGTDHLTAVTLAARAAVKAKWPGTEVGGYRSGPDAQDHGLGKALDCMTTNQAKGDAIAAWAKTQPGFHYCIWQQRIWNIDMPTRDGDGWHKMEDRGGKTANHMDHVHISFK